MVCMNFAVLPDQHARDVHDDETRPPGPKEPAAKKSVADGLGVGHLTANLQIHLRDRARAEPEEHAPPSTGE